MAKRAQPLTLFLCLFLVLALSLSGCGKKEETVKESEISVSTARAEVRDVAKQVKYSGVARGINEVYIIPKAAARVTAIHVKPGDRVGAGQTIISLDSSDYEAGVAQAEAAVALAEAQKRAREVELETLQSNYERTEKLFKAGAASSQQLESLKAQVDAAQAGIPEAMVEQARAGLLQAQTAISHCSVTAPVSGTVGALNVSLGEMVSPQSPNPVAVVSDTSSLEVEVLVSENEISYVKTGSSVQVYFKAASSKPFTGRVDSVATVPDPQKHNYKVKVLLANKDNLIKSGMFAEVSVDTISKQGVLAIPLTAVIPRGGHEAVYVLDKDKRAREKVVKTGLKNDRYIEILEGLKAGDQVVVKGNTLLNEGTLVRVVSGGAK